MKYHLIVLKAHAAGYSNHFTYETAKDLEDDMDKLVRKYSYDCEQDYLVIKGDEIKIELSKTHRLREAK